MSPITMSTPWTLVPQPRPAAPLRLYCFPYAGGGASIFRHWADLLPPFIEMRAVRLPGGEGRLREQPIGSLDTLVESMVASFGPELREKPFALFGHSNGALTAFELTRALRRGGYRLPVHLFASGSPAPQLELNEPPLAELPDAEFIEELRHVDGTPPEVFEHRELLELLLPAIRAGYSLRETYRYRDEPPLPLPVTVLAGEADGEVAVADASAWRAQSSCPGGVDIIPGGHFFINDQRPAVIGHVTRELTARLASMPLSH